MSAQQLSIRLGQCTDRGCKAVNQDFHGLVAPREPLLTAKGIAMAIADGISSSNVSQIASATSVRVFLEDYYATPESWSVKTSVYRVLQAANSWLYAQTRNGPYRYDMDRGYVCTFSALVIKSVTAHLFHIGDTRIYRLIDNGLEQLTQDHGVQMSGSKRYLGRALGMRESLEIDYRTFPVEIDDIFISSTDGVHEFVSEKFVIETIRENQNDLDQARSQVGWGLTPEELFKCVFKSNFSIFTPKVSWVLRHS